MAHRNIGVPVKKEIENLKVFYQFFSNEKPEKFLIFFIKILVIFFIFLYIYSEG